MTNSKIYAKDVWAETIFELFYETVRKDGGDGAACICCSNIEETADAFVKWFIENKNWKDTKEFYHPKDEYEVLGANYINFHNNNENYMFCDKKTFLEHGDLNIYIEEDCGNMVGDFTIKKLERGQDCDDDERMRKLTSSWGKNLKEDML